MATVLLHEMTRSIAVAWRQLLIRLWPTAIGTAEKIMQHLRFGFIPFPLCQSQASTMIAM
jgi:hypothetical protein